jgi:hypothetical protein
LYLGSKGTWQFFCLAYTFFADLNHLRTVLARFSRTVIILGTRVVQMLYLIVDEPL